MQQNSPVIPAEESHDRRGTVAVFVMIMLPVLLGLAALAIDVGQIYSSRAATQDTADAGALAGTSALRQGEWEFAQQRALEVIVRNQEAQGYSSPGDQTVEIGLWDKVTTTFTPLDPTYVTSANAVRVVAVRNGLPLFFAAIFGRTSTDIAREAVALVTPSCGGIWGLESITVPGNAVIDSYDSTAGPYSSGSAQDNGDVCSNGAVTISGSAEVHGDVLGSSVDLNGGSIIVTGIVEESVDPVTVEAVDFGDVEFNNDNASIGLTDQGNDPIVQGDHLHLGSGENLTLAPGTYYFTHLKIYGSASLSLTGPTTIYLAGNMDGDGSSVINTTQNTHDLTIICSGTRVEMDSNAAFYGSILAPNAEIDLRGNGDYFGALVGRAVKMSGSFQFHVDESLSLVPILKRPPVLVK